MSKAEFERLQKEYMAAAMRTAEKGKSIETATAPTHNVKKASDTSKTVTVTETHITQQTTAVSVAERNNEDNIVSEEISDKLSDIKAVAISDNTNESFVDSIEHAEEKHTNINIFLNEATLTVSEETEISSEAPDASDKCDKTADIPQNATNVQQTQNATSEPTSEATEDCETPCELSDDEIFDSFEDVFMSENEADEKAESLSAQKQKPCPAPDFNTSIHNHNKSINKSTKPCGCERCRCQNGNNMQEKGGQKPN